MLPLGAIARSRGLSSGSVTNRNAWIGPVGANATMLLLMAASAAIFAYLALFWTVPTAVLGSSARAGGIAVVSSIGASGSALSPTFIGWMQVLTGSLYGAITALALMFLASLVALWLCFPPPTVERRGHSQALAHPAE